jgi:hypothetical protein
VGSNRPHLGNRYTDGFRAPVVCGPR